MGINNLLLIACPGCSMPGPTVSLITPSHVVYAWLIVIVALCFVPMLTMMRVLFIARRRRHSSRWKLWCMSIILSAVYLFCFGPASSFGSAICFWLFLPLNIIMVIMMGLIWNVENLALAILPILTVPLYFYLFLKLLYRFDRKFYWRWGKTGRRLLRMQKTIVAGD